MPEMCYDLLSIVCGVVSGILVFKRLNKKLTNKATQLGNDVSIRDIKNLRIICTGVSFIITFIIQVLLNVL